MTIIRKANNGFWNNANSRSTEWVGSLQKSVPGETLARFERAEAAHKNGLESAPFFVGAVLAGNMVRLGGCEFFSFFFSSSLFEEGEWEGFLLTK